MKIIQVYINNSLRNFNYILYSESSKDAIFFDPTDLSITLPEAQKRGLNPKYLLNTHLHHDHIADNTRFLELDNTEHLKLKNNEKFYLEENSYILCLDTPGHTVNHQCFFLYEDNRCVGVIAGDTVFNAGIGNCKNGGDVHTLYNTIKNIFVPLSDEVKIYPSHDYFLNNLSFAASIEPDNKKINEYQVLVEKYKEKNEFYITNIAEEKMINPFFRVFTNKSDNTEDVFVKLRQKRDKW